MQALFSIFLYFCEFFSSQLFAAPLHSSSLPFHICQYRLQRLIQLLSYSKESGISFRFFKNFHPQSPRPSSPYYTHKHLNFPFSSALAIIKKILLLFSLYLSHIRQSSHGCPFLKGHFHCYCKGKVRPVSIYTFHEHSGRFCR